MKIKLIVCVWFAIAQQLYVQAQGQRTAFVQIQKVLEMMPEYKASKIELETYQKSLNNRLKTEEAKTQAYYQSVMEKVQNGSLTPAQQKEAEEKLQRMQEDLQKLAAQMEGALQEKEASLTARTMEKFNKALIVVAQQNGYDYVIDQSTALYANPNHDITPKVLRHLGLE